MSDAAPLRPHRRDARSGWFRHRPVTGSAGLLLAVLLSSAVALGPALPAAAVGVVVIEGRGFGHGVGLAQDGAYWMARAGRSDVQILQHFYPGAVLGRQTGPVRVPLGRGSAATIDAPDGATVTDGTTSQTVPPGSVLTVRSGTGVVTVTVQNPSTRPSSGGPAPMGPATKGPTSRSTASTNTASTNTASTNTASTGSRSGRTASGGTGTRGAAVPVPAPEPPSGPPVAAVEPRPPTSDGTGSGGTGSGGATGDASIDDMPGAPSLPTTTASVPLAPEPETGTDEAEPSDTSGIRAGAPGRPEQAVPSGPGSGRAAGGPTSLAPAGPASSAVTASVVRVLAPVGLTVGYAGRRYRGAMVFSGSPSGMTITTEVDVEDYLRGMGEIRDPRWPAASLRAQAIAARTFALDTMAKAGEVCPTQRCQVYLGAQVEYPEMDAAVRATAGQVLTHEGRLILAFYSASGGGSIATPEEAFGGTAEGHPYLRAGGYLTGDVQRWEVRVGLADLAARLGYPGRPDGVRVAKVGPSGRPLEITMWGASGERSWPATTVDRILGLRSNLFTISLEEAATAPAPLPGEPLTGELAVSAQRALLTGSSTTTTPTAPSTTRADTGQAGTTVQPAGQAATASSAGQAVTASSTGQPSVQPAAGPSTTASSTGGGDGTVTRSAAGIVVSGPVLSALATLALLGAAAWIARRWRLD